MRLTHVNRVSGTIFRKLLFSSKQKDIQTEEKILNMEDAQV